jgi:hypothetical protein
MISCICPNQSAETCINNHIECVNIIINSGIYFIELPYNSSAAAPEEYHVLSALCISVYRNHIYSVKTLIELGVNVNGGYLFFDRVYTTVFTDNWGRENIKNEAVTCMERAYQDHRT